ncbi:hypothetical protein [Planktothrix pseudagardhii]|uniref:Uncharacterized protein n=1 Tax=Planktothrix pseudagardhii TaxID=132604 RepID=A0A9W4G454_9CYAN|nr:hypothetical protein [Planktothrix pseudagardhii]CAD5932485.1 hypothetical protein NO713_01380 [Planktothrix pseudagardhii]
MLSENITKIISELNFSELKLARKNLDIPEWKEVQQFLEDINERFYALEANRVSEVEKIKIITDSGWLLPTSTFSKPVFDLLVDFGQIQDIDSFFRETLMIPEHIKKPYQKRMLGMIKFQNFSKVKL